MVNRFGEYNVTIFFINSSHMARIIPNFGVTKNLHLTFETFTIYINLKAKHETLNGHTGLVGKCHFTKT